MRGRTKTFGVDMSMYVVDKLLEKYNKIWNKVSNSIKKEFDSEPVESKRYLRTKTKYYKNKIEIYFLIIKFQKKILIIFVCH